MLYYVRVISVIFSLLIYTALSIASKVSSQFAFESELQAPFADRVHEAKHWTLPESLSTLSDSTFTSLHHPFFPKHSVRIKKTRFCDTTVNAYTGYIDISPRRHFFFYFFESRASPEKDDVVLWTNGGPGCSSTLGLLFELGPCRVTSNGTDTTTTFHPESWNTNANVFFVDQPIGTGFSYSEGQPVVSTAQEAADDIVAFLTIFFEHFTNFRGRRLHLAGESYAGRLLPVFASVIYDKNPELVSAGMESINLISVMMGDGLTDWLKMLPSYYDMNENCCRPV